MSFHVCEALSSIPNIGKTRQASNQLMNQLHKEIKLKQTNKQANNNKICLFRERRIWMVCALESFTQLANLSKNLSENILIV